MADQPDIDLAMREMGRLSADKAMCSSLAHRLTKHAPDLVQHLVERDVARKATLPFPDKSAITALETAIFDNWIPFGGKRPKKGSKGHNLQRYRAVLKVWTVPVREINFASKRGLQKFEVLLQPPSELEARAKRLAKSHPDLSATLIELSHYEQMKARLAGPLTSKPVGEGTIFHGSQVFMIDADMADPVGAVVDLANNASMRLPPFSTRDAAGRALAGNVILQSRYGRDPLLSNWTTR